MDCDAGELIYNVRNKSNKLEKKKKKSIDFSHCKQGKSGTLELTTVG